MTSSERREDYACKKHTIIWVAVLLLTLLGSSALSDSTLQLPSSLSVVSEESFANCVDIEHIVIPSTTVSILNNAFSNCNNLVDVLIPESVTFIDDTAFDGCPNLIVKVFKNTYADNWTEGREGITRVYVENERYRSGDYLYSQSSSNTITIIKYDGEEIGELVIPSHIDGFTVTEIGEEAFKYCQASSIVLPNTLLSIDYGAFYYCRSLNQITLPESLTSIASCAFMGCGSLEAITIPAATTELGSGLFRGCRSLVSIEVATDNQYFEIFEDALIRKDNMELITMPFGSVNDTLIIPNGIKIIGDTAFGYEGPSIQTLIIPDSVEEIRSSSFAFSSVQHIEIGSGVRVMDSPFSYCQSLKTVVIKEGTTAIGSYAFNNCVNLETITIPDSVTSIAEDAFYNDLYVSFIANENSHAAQFAIEHGIPRIAP